MTCYYPLQGYRARSVNDSGKRSIVFNLKDGFHDLPVVLPCGKCIGCRLERSRQWAIRCIHEASLYDRGYNNSFVTLTYSPEFLPFDGSLNVRHFQLFMKRLRKRFGDGIRFFHCGEYGDKTLRPHYHAILFNLIFPDKKLLKKSYSGDDLFTSDILDSLWGMGHCFIGNVTFESAAYVARYIMKKVTGDAADEHYVRVDPDTGEFFRVKPEYTTMSRRPGIGKIWFDRFSSDVYPKDFFTIRGKEMRPPKYYDSQFEILDPESFDVIKSRRKAVAKRLADDNTSDRLAVKEKVKLTQLSRLYRNLE